MMRRRVWTVLALAGTPGLGLLRAVRVGRRIDALWGDTAHVGGCSPDE